MEFQKTPPLALPVSRKAVVYPQALTKEGTTPARATQMALVQPRFLTLWYQAFATDLTLTQQEDADAISNTWSTLTAEKSRSRVGRHFNRSAALSKSLLLRGLAALLSPANVIRAILYPVVHLGAYVIEKMWQAVHAHGNRNLRGKIFFAWAAWGFATLVTAPFWLVKQVLDPLANSYAKAIEYAFFPPVAVQDGHRALAFLGALGVIGLTIACFVTPPVVAFIKPAVVAISALLSAHFSSATVIGIIVTTKVMAPATAWSVLSTIPQASSRISRAWEKLKVFCGQTFRRVEPPAPPRNPAVTRTGSHASSVTTPPPSHPTVTQNPTFRSLTAPAPTRAPTRDELNKLFLHVPPDSPPQVATAWFRTFKPDLPPVKQKQCSPDNTSILKHLGFI